MSDSEKAQRKALVASACRTGNSAARLEIFILEHLREKGADTRRIMAAIQEAKEGRFDPLEAVFEQPGPPQAHSLRPFQYQRPEQDQ